MTATEVAELCGVSPEWVKRNMPHKVTLGHSTVRWYEYDVLEWLAVNRAA